MKKNQITKQNSLIDSGWTVGEKHIPLWLLNYI